MKRVMKKVMKRQNYNPNGSIPWNDINSNVRKVDKFDMWSISMLYNNCERFHIQLDPSYRRVNIHPSLWFDDLVPFIIDNVSYISNGPSSELIYFENGKLFSKNFKNSEKEFNSIDEIKSFLGKKRFTDICLYSIQNSIDVISRKYKCVMSYSELTNIEKAREMKIEYLTDGEKDISDDEDYFLND